MITPRERRYRGNRKCSRTESQRVPNFKGQADEENPSVRLRRICQRVIGALMRD